MSHSPLVSVIIPAYNRALLIAQTLASVREQTFKDYEIIVVDDGSTDATAQVVAGFGCGVKYIFKQNGGQASARNVGIQNTTGEFIAFLDSDDLWLPDKLAKQLACLKKTNRQWIYCDAEAFDHVTGKLLDRFSRIGHRPQQDFIARQLICGNFIPSPTPVVRRIVFDHVGRFDESSEMRSIGEDWEMWLRIAARYEIAYVPEVLARYRVHSGSGTCRFDPLAVLSSRMMVVKRAVAFAPDIYARYHRQAQAMAYVDIGNSLVKRGNPKSAQSLYVRAIICRPLCGRAYMWGFVALLGRPLTRALVIVFLWLHRRGI